MSNTMTALIKERGGDKLLTQPSVSNIAVGIEAFSMVLESGEIITLQLSRWMLLSAYVSPDRAEREEAATPLSVGYVQYHVVNMAGIQEMATHNPQAVRNFLEGKTLENFAVAMFDADGELISRVRSDDWLGAMFG